MNQKELDIILEQHVLWLKDPSKGKKANLSRADLYGAYLARAYLARADLSGANLIGANLTRANLYGTNLTGANLTGADLAEANLSGANLSRADLFGANLSGANLYGADLSEANLTDANLSGAKLPDFLIVPQKGSFIVYKKLQDNLIAELEIPESAGRINSLVGRKCRVSEAKVLSITSLDGLTKYKKAIDGHTGALKYIVGKTVKPDKFDNDVRVECINGIHCFITRREAEEY